MLSIACKVTTDSVRAARYIAAMALAMTPTDGETIMFLPRLLAVLALSTLAGAALAEPAGVVTPRERAELRRDQREIRQDRREIHRDRVETRQDRRELRQERREGDAAGVAAARQELRQDHRETRQDKRELRQDRRERNRDVRAAVR